MSRLTVVLLVLATATASGQRSQARGISNDDARLLLALDRLQANRWYPSTPALREDARQDEALLSQALGSGNPTLRRLAVRGVGRFEWPAYIPALVPFLADIDPGVRREAVHAIALTVVHGKDEAIAAAYEALTAPQPPLMTRDGAVLRGPEVAAIEQARLDAIARLHYPREMAQQVLRTFLPGQTRPILLLLRQHPGLELTPAQLQPLLEQIRIVDPLRLPSPEAFEVLKLTGHLTTSLIVAASAHKCPQDNLPFPCSALRQLGVQNLIADDPAMVNALRNALDDPWPEVRVHALRRVGEAVKRTGDCGPLLDSLMDARELAMVRIEALDQLDPRCDQIKDAIRLAREYTVVPDSAASTPTQGWALRARAIEVLARLDPAATLDALEHAPRDVWQVRAARARTAMALRSLEWLRKYADDDDPNVRTEVLRDLTQLRDPSRIDLAIRSLDSTDYELVATATDVLEREDPPIESAVPALWSTFKRLTLETRETTRFARLAILECLEAWAPPRNNITPVRPYVEDLRLLLRDVDPFVAESASRVIFKVTGVKLVAAPIWRPPLQPDLTDLFTLPAGATFVLDSGEMIGIEFLRNEAPIAIARFVKLVKSGYFRDQPLLYRIVPMIAVNGGSPDGNDLSGDTRFWRDEIGLEHHSAGVIGLLSHGRDTADGRFFINLTDQSSFDDEFTLFARIVTMRLNEPWAYATPPPVSALVRGGNILTVRWGS